MDPYLHSIPTHMNKCTKLDWGACQCHPSLLLKILHLEKLPCFMRHPCLEMFRAAGCDTLQRQQPEKRLDWNVLPKKIAASGCQQSPQKSVKELPTV